MPYLMDRTSSVPAHVTDQIGGLAQLDLVLVGVLEDRHYLAGNGVLALVVKLLELLKSLVGQEGADAALAQNIKIGLNHDVFSFRVLNLNHCVGVEDHNGVTVPPIQSEI